MAIDLSFHVASGSLHISLWLMPRDWSVGVGRYGFDAGPLSVGWVKDRMPC